MLTDRKSFFNDIIKNNVDYGANIDLPYSGWNRVIISLHRKLKMLDPDYRITGINIHSGMLLFQFETNVQYKSSKDAMYRYTQLAMIESSNVCIKCSKPAFPTVLDKQVLPLCINCKN